MKRSALLILKVLFAAQCLGTNAFAVTLNPPAMLRFATGTNSVTITHGSQLTAAMTGPSGLGVSIAQLATINAPGSYWGVSSGSRPGFVPAGDYVYNNDPTNHGGTVPAGGLVIDGFAIPAGTWVTQFYNFNQDMYISSTAGPGLLIRGCRFRNNIKAPGNINVAYSPRANISLWVFHNDAGGLGAANAQYNEVPFSTGGGVNKSYYYRNYISYTTTAIQPADSNPTIIENYIEKITCYYCPSSPPGESTSKHLNGISLNGGQTSALILRNHVVLQSPDDAGRTIDQTDALAFFQDFGSFPGTGSNLDGTVGYQVRDNFFGGGGYTIYAGMNSGKASTSVQNMVITGNKITTQWWPRGGSYGAISAPPVWGSYGNLKSNNTFAESGVEW